jgi:hypothetical protein
LTESDNFIAKAPGRGLRKTTRDDSHEGRNPQCLAAHTWATQVELLAAHDALTLHSKFCSHFNEAFMLKKILALATTTAMLGAHAAAYALNTARAAVRTVTGAAAPGNEEKAAPFDGRKVLPSIPPMPDAAPPKTRARATSAARKPSGHKANRTKARVSRPAKKTGKR